ncbi:putative basic amino acid antiporter YfcC [Altererythrobacter lutimaris]|uniref:Putative basic amino acid antiporter YfcC n=1 Tax=Altererythrobacter lutimaris TaxID=2743979 RepID=A0A850HCH7_9SPHN|nr:putative basic amino acid antiporter YfcC [Altererythrobacter lutimaris]NVE94338.1 putative basic amino acid antiporter YfcC [Altererythrobacter lutimaris]
MADTADQANKAAGEAHQERAWQMPDTFIILFVLALVAWAATFVFTPGQFSLAGDPSRIVPGSYEAAASTMPAPILGDAERTGFLDFLFAGLVTGDRYSPTVGLMAFIIVLGGVFGMVMRTKAIDAALEASLPGGKAQSEWLIMGLFWSFSLAGAIFGLAEESIALTLVLAPALTRAGYDGMTALLVCFGASQLGFATSWMNPFSVIIAQTIAGLAPMSGLELRLGNWLLFTGVGAIFLWRYARGVRLGTREGIGKALFDASGPATAGFSMAHLLVLLSLIAGIAWVAWGVTMYGYYLPEIAAQFFAMGLAVALIARFGGIEGGEFGQMMEAFRDGAAQLLPAAIIVGAAKGIMLILGGDDPASPSLLNSLLNSLAGFAGSVPDWMTAWAMYLVQSGFNFFVTSGSGQASITMPIMAPLADLTGVTRQTAVLAFQLGDGLTNLIVPTSAVLMACLAAAKVSYGQWLAFMWKPMLALMGLASVIVLAAHAIGY